MKVAAVFDTTTYGVDVLVALFESAEAAVDWINDPGVNCYEYLPNHFRAEAYNMVSHGGSEKHAIERLRRHVRDDTRIQMMEVL